MAAAVTAAGAAPGSGSSRGGGPAGPVSAVFDALPGLAVGVGEALPALARVWEAEPGAAGAAPSSFRASQMTFVLHFGFAAQPAEAGEVFAATVRFAQRHPCRILVLCPVEAPAEEVDLRAKVYAECFIGTSRREMSCCEAILLSYARASRGFLENAVSTLLESDLPVYYRPHRFLVGARILEYPFLIGSAARVVVDSSADGDELVRAAWPVGTTVRDVVHGRLLPARQAIGQHLGSIPPGRIVGDLRCCTVVAGPDLEAEGRALAAWLRGGPGACAGAGRPAGWEERRGVAAPGVLGCRLEAADGRCFAWEADTRTGRGWIRSDLSGGPRRELPVPGRLLEAEAALAEAVFF